MKFGYQLELYAIPEWQDKYIRYNYLKRFVTRRKAEESRPRRNLSAFRRSLETTEPPGGPSPSAIETIDREFIELLDAEIKKVALHFTDQFAILKDRLSGVEEELDAIEREQISRTATTIENEVYIANLSQDTAETNVSVAARGEDAGFDDDSSSIAGGSLTQRTTDVGIRAKIGSEPRQSLLRLVVHLPDLGFRRASHREQLSCLVLKIWDSTDRLESFIQLNMVALYKILKKRDKTLGLQRMTLDLATKKRTFGELVVPKAWKDGLSRLYHRANNSDAIDTVVEDMATIVQKQFLSSHMTAAPAWVNFFLGSCLVVLLDIIVAAIVPPTSVMFSLETVLVMLPIFRLSFIVALIFWGAGAAVQTFEDYGVNYKFLLDIDPKCQVSSGTLFSAASCLTSIWVVGFGAFLADAKFGLFLRPSLHWLYPFAVVIAQGLIFVLPSVTFRYSYRRSFLVALWEAISTGFYPTGRVTLVDNILGDILTSLPKPLLDLKYTITFFTGLYFLDETFSFEGSFTKLDSILLPLITLLPYWIRLVQCGTRWKNEPNRRTTHGANMGKYFSTIVVILTSNINWKQFSLSIYASRLIFVFVYLFASLYNLIWDVVMDWGLMPDPNNFVRPDHRIMYPQWIYYMITMFNLMARLTWALTLIPINVIDNYRLSVSVIIYLISFLEVLRRSVWLILRLENEHLTNSSQYRAMLWVPKLKEAMVKQQRSITDDYVLTKASTNVPLNGNHLPWKTVKSLQKFSSVQCMVPAEEKRAIKDGSLQASKLPNILEVNGTKTS